MRDCSSPRTGPGLLENTYESTLCVVLDDSGLTYQRQVPFPVIYKGRTVGEYRFDLILVDTVIAEIKSMKRFDPVSEAEALTYLRVSGKKVGLCLSGDTYGRNRHEET